MKTPEDNMFAFGGDPNTKRVQEVLNGLGYGLTVDGIAGPKTNAAKAKFLELDSNDYSTPPTAPAMRNYFSQNAKVSDMDLTPTLYTGPGEAPTLPDFTQQAGAKGSNPLNLDTSSILRGAGAII